MFVNDNLALAIDLSGLNKLTAKVQALSLPNLDELWYTEIPVGRRQRFTGTWWLDEPANQLFIGGGPVSAVELNTGKVLWSLPYDSIGVAHRAIIGESKLLLLGTKKSGFKFNIMGGGIDKASNWANEQQAAYGHKQNPILFCIDKAGGNIDWRLPFEPGKEHKKKKKSIWSGETEYKIREETRLNLVGSNGSSVYPDMLHAKLLLQAKQTQCVDLQTGKTIWQPKKPLRGMAVPVADRLLVITDDHLCALRPADGSEEWRFKDKVNCDWSMESSFSLVGQDALVNVGGRPVCVNISTGQQKWKSDKEIGETSMFTVAADFRNSSAYIRANTT